MILKKVDNLSDVFKLNAHTFSDPSSEGENKDLSRLPLPIDPCGTMLLDCDPRDNGRTDSCYYEDVMALESALVGSFLLLIPPRL